MGTANSITISVDLLKAIVQLIGGKRIRSEFIEAILRKYLAEEQSKRRNENDLKILNAKSDYLNEEAEEVLDYQVKL